MDPSCHAKDNPSCYAQDNKSNTIVALAEVVRVHGKLENNPSCCAKDNQSTKIVALAEVVRRKNNPSCYAQDNQSSTIVALAEVVHGKNTDPSCYGIVADTSESRARAADRRAGQLDSGKNYIVLPVMERSAELQGT